MRQWQWPIAELIKLYTYFVPTGEMAVKAFLRSRDKYARAKKAMKEKNKSGTSSKAVKKARETLYRLQYMQ